MRATLLLPLAFGAIASSLPAAYAQTYVLATGQDPAYTELNAALGGTAYEVPDCGHGAFGPHITEDYDDELASFVFLFHAHVTPDNDRCVAFDRQRVEIKTYGPSPAYVKG